ncbi:MAG: PorT family protein [Prevotella sp.]|nr:PorT family protein [Prevotella sp.]
MKKNIFLALALVTVMHSQAQSLWDTSKPDRNITFGVRVGHNASSMDGETEAAGVKSGITAGVSVDYNIIKSLSLVSGLYYSAKGFGYVGEDNDDRAELSYVQIPLQLSYRIETVTKVQFHFNVGLYGAYGLGGSLKLMPQDLAYFYKFDQDAFGDNGFFKHLDIGLTAGAHMQLGHFLIGLTYEYGLSDIAKVYGEFNNRNIALTLGYNF